MGKKLAGIAHIIALRAAATLILAVKLARVKLASRSFIFFCWYYFGVTLARHQEGWAEFLLQSARAVLCAPRMHGKSEVAAKLLPLWLICRNRNIRILVVTAAGGSKGLAKKHVMVIRHELRRNQRLINDFGQFYNHSHSRIWQSEAIEVIRTKNMKDPTLEATGVYGSPTGGRFDVIIFDDVIDLKKTNTAELIQKLKEEVLRTYLPLLERGGRVWMIGTRKRFGDIYQDRIENPMWRSRVDPAILREPENYEIRKLDQPIEVEDGTLQEFEVIFRGKDRGEVLWPGERPMEWLLLERVNLGTRVFNAEYQSIIVDDSTAPFPLAHLHQCRDEGLSYVRGVISEERHKRYLYIIHAVDPALAVDEKEAEKNEDSYFVQAGIGLLPNLTRELIAIDRFRGKSPHEKEESIKKFYKRLNPFRCVIEKNAFGIIHAHNLIEGTDMKLTKHKTDTNKNDPYEGIPHLGAQFECMNYRLPYATEEDQELSKTLIDELHRFPLGEYSDQVMALWIGEYYILRILKGQARMRRLKEQSSK